ncbi:MAG TPA: hypothetical protein VFV89_08500 [Nocardioides sp.]|uniref:hypothetical protein n=1 Tax=Nocardioides sp. TaxID=35761 RepID=UPI002E3483F4|nr:hypothetical protein [Nocardioides sp.]HEX5087834.1 hypothetical protein [Nocardioides sp.]
MSPSAVSTVDPGRAKVHRPVRDGVAMVCAASAGVHAALVPAHLQEGPLIGAAFGLSVLLLAAAALGVRTSPGPAYRIAAVLLGVSGCYLLSRTTGIPLLIPEPEPVDVLGTVTSLAEVAAAVAVLGLPRTRKEPR